MLLSPSAWAVQAIHDNQAQPYGARGVTLTVSWPNNSKCPWWVPVTWGRSRPVLGRSQVHWMLVDRGFRRSADRHGTLSTLSRWWWPK